MSQTTTARGRLAVADPDLGFDTLDGGTALHAALSTMFTQFSDHLMSRYKTATVANSGTTVILHNFGLNLNKLKVQIWESGVLRTDAQVAADYTIAETGGSSTVSTTITNVSGGAKTFLAVIWGGKFGINQGDFDEACSIDTTGNIRASELRALGNDLVLNHDAVGSGADWALTLRRPSSGMSAAAIITLPAATAALATLALAETLANKTLTAVVGITLAASASIDWAAGNAAIGASIGANTLTIGGVSSTVRVPGTLSIGTLATDSDDLVLNNDAASSGADWALTLHRPTSGMSAAATITLPTATANLATIALAETLSNKTLTAVVAITLAASAAIDWAAGNVAFGASIGANTLTLAGASSTVRVPGTLSGAVLVTDSDDLVLNNDAASSGADWKATIRRSSSGMAAAAILTLPLVTGTLATLAGTEAFTNKDYDGGTASNTSRLTVPKAATATLLALTRKEGTILYDTSLGTMFYDNGAALLPFGSGGGGGGGGAVWHSVEGSGPVIGEVAGEQTWNFPAATAGGQLLKVWVKVPTGYVAGNQIKMRLGHFSPGSSSGTILIQTVSTLIQKASSALTSTTNQRTSTNAAITVGATANRYEEAVCDLTSASGQINAVSVAAGDMILVQLQRGTDTDTNDLGFLPSSTEVTFT